MKVLSPLFFAGFAFAAVPAMAMPGVCPAGMTATTMPSCEVGVAAFVSADAVTGCYHVSVNGHDYAVIPESTNAASPGGADDVGSAALRTALVHTKGEMRAFISSGGAQQVTCVLPNIVTKPLGVIN
jgi:hypothetical protein